MQQFIKKLYNDSELKANTIVELHRLGLRACVNKNFDLIPHQEKELDTIKNSDIEAIFTNTVIAALNRNGTIELIHEGRNPPNMRMEIYTDGKEVGIRFTC